MDSEESIYISLQEAAKHCEYSQEYLSLRARQGKLKAVKFGRNWVTKEEWLKEYLEKVEEYNNNKNHFQKFVSPPKNLPVEEGSFFSTFATLLRGSPIEKTPVLRFGFVTALVFVLLAAGCVLGKESFKNVYQDLNPIVIGFNENFDFHFTALVSEFNENFDKGAAELAKDISSYTYIVGGAGDIIVENTIKVATETISDVPQSFQYVNQEINSQLSTIAWGVAGVGELTTDALKEYGQWFSRLVRDFAMNSAKKLSNIISNGVRGYFVANDFIEKSIAQDIDDLVRGIRCLTSDVKHFYVRANNLLEEMLAQDVDNIVKGSKLLVSNIQKEITDFARTVDKAYRFVIRPWQELPEIPIVEKPIRPQPKEGAVVIPYSEKEAAEVKGKLEKAFSDKVVVESDETGRAGIIKPLIKEAEAQEYLYLIVPISEQ